MCYVYININLIKDTKPMTHDLIELQRLIGSRLDEFYPHAKGFTRILLEEMAEAFFEAQLGYEGFCIVLKEYRKHNEYANFIPKMPSLREYFPKDEAIPDTDIKLKQFAYHVERLGWDRACKEYAQDIDTLEWIEKVNISVKYSCFNSKYSEYLTMFHNGDVIAAKKYYIEHYKGRDILALRKELENFERIGEDMVKKKYPVFYKKSDKRATKKDIVKSVRYDHDGNAKKRQQAQIRAMLAVK